MHASEGEGHAGYAQAMELADATHATPSSRGAEDDGAPEYTPGDNASEAESGRTELSGIGAAQASAAPNSVAVK